MDSMTLRQVWTIIEETQSNVLLRLSDSDLVNQILHQLQHRRPLNQDETHTVSLYLGERLALIRDLAHARTCVSY